MTVKEFVKLDASGMMYKVVSANAVGYMASDKCIIEADRNVVTLRFGDNTLVGYCATGKNKMTIYIK